MIETIKKTIKVKKLEVFNELSASRTMSYPDPPSSPTIKSGCRGWTSLSIVGSQPEPVAANKVR